MQKKNNRIKSEQNSFSKAFVLIGLVLSFLGFVYPGWTWLMLTPGDTEMISLVGVTAVGAIGLVLLIIGSMEILLEKISQRSDGNNPNDTNERGEASK